MVSAPTVHLIIDGAFGLVKWGICEGCSVDDKASGGGLEFGDSSGLPKLCLSPRDPCAHRSKSKEAERTRRQACHSMEGCSRTWGALAQSPFLGALLMVPVGKL